MTKRRKLTTRRKGKGKTYKSKIRKTTRRHTKRTNKKIYMQIRGGSKGEDVAPVVVPENCPAWRYTPSYCSTLEHYLIQDAMFNPTNNPGCIEIATAKFNDFKDKCSNIKLPPSSSHELPPSRPCPSEGIEPINCEDKRDFIRQSRIFHPDKNPGCIDSSTEKFKTLSNICSDVL